MLFSCIETFSREPYLNVILIKSSYQFYLYVCFFFVLEVGVYLNIIKVSHWGSFVAPFSHNSIPVALCLVSYTVRIRSHIDFFNVVVNPDGNATFPFRYPLGDVINMRQ